jgi:hypothetical protein
MTAYRNFVSDFSQRCRQILDAYEKPTTLSGREVTLSLAIASAALIVPFERLCPSSADHVAPDRNKKWVGELGRLFNEPFLKWVGSGSWRQIRPTSAGTIQGQNVEQWLDPNAISPLSDERSVGSVLTVLRNSLAHGNLYTRSANGSAIQELVFLSKRREDRSTKPCAHCGRRAPQLIDEYEGVIATPRDFVALLRVWVDFLARLRLSEDPVQEGYFGIPVVAQ